MLTPSPFRREDDPGAAAGPHWTDRTSLLGLSVRRDPEIETPAYRNTSALWLSPRTLLFSIQVFVLLTIVATFQWVVSTKQFVFPNQPAALMVGLVFGMLISTQAWDLGTRWTTLLRLISGLVLVQLLYPALAKSLGGPADQWWSALVLMMLTAQAVQSMLQRHRLANRVSLGHKVPRSGKQSKLRLSLVDLMSFSCLLAIIFQLGKFSYQYPWVVLQSFAWFGGFATMVVISRFAILQMGKVFLVYRQGQPHCQVRAGSGTSASVSTNSLVARQRWFRTWVEIVGLLVVIAIIDGSVYQCLSIQRGPSESTFALLTILLVAQFWQIYDLWIQYLLSQQQGRLTAKSAT